MNSASSWRAARSRSADAVSRLLRKLRLGPAADRRAVTPKGLEVTCYTCTKRSVLDGVILGEVDFLGGAKSKVDAMLARAREHAAKVAKRPFTGRART